MTCNCLFYKIFKNILNVRISAKCAKEIFMAENKRAVTQEKLVALCKNRGFIFPGSEIYGGLANTWDYGPLGVELKNNIKKRGGKSL